MLEGTSCSLVVFSSNPFTIWMWWSRINTWQHQGVMYWTNPASWIHPTLMCNPVNRIVSEKVRPRLKRCMHSVTPLQSNREIWWLLKLGHKPLNGYVWVSSQHANSENLYSLTVIFWRSCTWSSLTYKPYAYTNCSAGCFTRFDALTHECSMKPTSNS